MYAYVICPHCDERILLRKTTLGVLRDRSERALKFTMDELLFHLREKHADHKSTSVPRVQYGDLEHD